MLTRMQTLTPQDIEKIHQASMAILSRGGIIFNDNESIEIFKKHGVKVEGKTVYLTEEQVMNAIGQAPSSFTVKALNPEKNVALGGPDYVLAPGYGPPFITLPGGQQREGLFSDYENFVKLVHTSKTLNMNGFMMVEPSDCDVRSSHLDMFLSGLFGCDKPLMGTPLSRQAAKDCVDLLAVAYGGHDKLMDHPATVSLCNSLSPMQFSEEMASSIIELARGGQAVCVAALIMAGSSGPITIPGVLALQNAEVLAGLTLAQLVRPGAPVIYGGTSSAMDLKSGALSLGAPEASIFISMTSQLAQHYKLPGRGGGALTDSLVLDTQAGAESAITLLNAINCGMNFIMHSTGIMGGYISISMEKYIMDEELAAIVKRMITPETFDEETIDVDSILRVGHGGHYLTEKKTFKLCRKLTFQTDVLNRANYEVWTNNGSNNFEAVAAEKLAARLASYTAPDYPESFKKDLRAKAKELAGGAPLKMG